MSKAVSRAAWAMIGLAVVATGLHIFEVSSISNDLIYLVAALQVFVAVIFGVVVNDAGHFGSLVLKRPISFGHWIIRHRAASIRSRSDQCRF